MSRNLKILQDLSKDQICADCGSREITHSSYNIGILLCSSCAAIHTSLGKEVSKVKEISIFWEDSQVERLKEKVGHGKTSDFERFVPIWWRRGKEGDHRIILQQWIYDKYLHKLFKKCPPAKEMKGFLKEDDTNRKFVLTQDSLSYFIKDKERCINTEFLDVSLKQLEDSRYLLQLDFPSNLNAKNQKDSPNNFNSSNWTTRHLYLSHDEEELLVKWYNLIRGVIYESLRKRWTMPESQILVQLNFTKVEGYLWKAGPSPSYAHRRRYFMLVGRKLMYHSEMFDPYPKGEIFLGMNGNYKISPVGFGEDVGRFSFSLHTPYRTFVLASESEDERDNWVISITNVLETEISPRDKEISEKLLRKRGTGFLSR